jgi:hypothetical protein
MQLRQYGVACTLYFPLIDKGATDFESTPVTIASGDCKISKDGGAFANTTTASFSHVAGGIYSIPLTATEMQAKNIVVKIVDQTGTKEWEDQCIIIDTVNHASAEIPSLWGILQSTASGAITATSLAADTITAAKVATDVTTELQSGLATAAALATVDDFLDTEIAAIKAKTDNIPAAPAAVGDIPTAIQNADALLKRDVDNVEATAPVHSLASALLKLVSRFKASTGETFRTDAVTVHMTQTPTVDASADPITELGAAA